MARSWSCHGKAIESMAPLQHLPWKSNLVQSHGRSFLSGCIVMLSYPSNGSALPMLCPAMKAVPCQGCDTAKELTWHHHGTAPLVLHRLAIALAWCYSLFCCRYSPQFLRYFVVICPLFADVLFLFLSVFCVI